MLRLQNKPGGLTFSAAQDRTLMGNERLYTYIPGNCNLGAAEIKRRFRIGYIGLAASILLVLLFYVFDVERTWRLLVFAPVFYSLSGFIQARNKFCYLYGFKSVFSLTGKRNLTRITNAEFKRKDRIKALVIVSITLLLSALLTITYFVL